MSRTGKVSRTFEFLLVFGENPSKSLRAAEKSQGAAEKINKKLNLTALASQQSSLVLSQYKCSVLPGKQKFKC